MPILLTCLLALCSLAMAHQENIDAIYGEDNRHEVYSYDKPEIIELAKSTVALIKVGAFQEIDELLKMTYVTFEKSNNLCSEERFKDQPTPAFCSGFLISPTKIVSAGHCIKSESDCANTRFIFDFMMTDETTAVTSFTKDQVFSCSRILGWKKVAGAIDFSILELDRPVVGRKPLKLSDNKSLSVSDRLFVIGHPAGLPAKITDNAQVKSLRRDFFVTNTDTYGGNSGSAVFNEKSLEVEGILVRGNTDFRNKGNCSTSTYYGENEGAEQATLISRIEENYTQDPDSPQATNGYRYVWISFRGCVEMLDNEYNRIVDTKFCPDAPPLQYAWNENYTICREIRGSTIIQEVAPSYCPQLRYVWKNFYTKCAEYRGEQFIRYTERRYCRGEI